MSENFTIDTAADAFSSPNSNLETLLKQHTSIENDVRCFYDC